MPDEFFFYCLQSLFIGRVMQRGYSSYFCRNENRPMQASGGMGKEFIFRNGAALAS